MNQTIAAFLIGSAIATATTANAADTHPVGDAIRSFGQTIGNIFRPSQSPEELAVADDAQCRGYGFRPQTEGYANCRLKLAELRANQKAATIRAAPPPNQPLQSDPGRSFMCKNAIANKDSGGVFVFC